MKIINSHITGILIRKAGNEKFLEGLVNRDILDLAMIYYLPTRKNGTPLWVSQKMADDLNLSEETMYAEALNNAEKDVYCIRLTDFMKKMLPFFPESKDDPSFASSREDLMVQNVHICTYSNKKYGAVTMLTGAMKKLSDIYGKSNLIVFPSSVHEVMVCPTRCNGKSYEEALDIVRSANRIAVSDEDFLSDSVYIYDAEKGEIRFATEEDFSYSFVLELDSRL